MIMRDLEPEEDEKGRAQRALIEPLAPTMSEALDLSLDLSVI